MTEDEVKEKIERIQELINKADTNEGRDDNDDKEIALISFELLANFLIDQKKILNELQFQSIELENLTTAIRNQ